MNKILGVITARGGSKGIPGKNIKPMLGKPLIAYTIEAAKDSRVFDRLILSTDDPEIARVAREYGCEVPFMRPAELSDDKAGHLGVMRHAAEELQRLGGYKPDYIMILQPTSPLRQAFHIKKAAELILESGADSVLSVAEIPENFSPYKAMVADVAESLVLFNGSPVRKRTARRQDLQKAYWSVGMIYLFKTDLLFGNEPNFYGDQVKPYVVDAKYVIDINNPEDWEAAEKALRKIANSQ